LSTPEAIYGVKWIRRKHRTQTPKGINDNDHVESKNTNDECIEDDHILREDDDIEVEYAESSNSMAHINKKRRVQQADYIFYDNYICHRGGKKQERKESLKEEFQEKPEVLQRRLKRLPALPNFKSKGTPKVPI
jgi:hypothetical protein